MNVNWNDAQAYVAWLSSRAGHTYRLPSEAEREYVTRAGTTTPFWWGSTLTPDHANYSVSWPDQVSDKTLPVKSFLPNPWGLYQVHGNVWEWLEDCKYGYSEVPEEGTARIGTGGCDVRLIRGGAWITTSWALRSARRNAADPAERHHHIGFRVARTIFPEDYAQVPFSEAAQAWISVQNTESEGVLEEFLRQFSNGVYAGFAKARLEELRRQHITCDPGGWWWWPWGSPKCAKKVDAAPGGSTQVEPVCEDGALVSLAQSTTRLCVKPGSGQSFQDCPDCPEMVVVPAGSFNMGSPEWEPQRNATESPIHKVTFTEPFAVGRFSVTFAEWDACWADGGCGGYRPVTNWGRGDMPVVRVNFDDAKAYLQWVTQKTGKHYRLLSEAEREYVTRAGTETPFWWGTSITPNKQTITEAAALMRVEAAKARFETRLCLYNPSSQTLGGFIRFMATFRNGWRIALVLITLTRHSTAPRGKPGGGVTHVLSAGETTIPSRRIFGLLGALLPDESFVLLRSAFALPGI